MAKKKFNLKDYIKVSGDEHIEYRLKQERDKKRANQTGEAQLEEYRYKKPNALTEKQLADTRSGGDGELVERRLDTYKSKFKNSYRNPSAYKGDINKLEEKRLKNNPVEDEKYESASSVPDGLRWWKDKKSPDGLKIARKINKKAQVEELTFDKPRWGDFPVETGEEGVEWRDPDELADEEFDIIDETLMDDDDDSVDNVVGGDVFEEVVYDEQNVSGTPLSIGKIKVNTEVTEINEDDIIRDVIDYVEEKHPHLNVSKDSLDLSKLKNGEIGYVVAQDRDTEEFPIEEASETFASKNVKINKKAQVEELTFDKPRWGDFPVETGEEGVEWRDPDELADEEFDIIDETLMDDDDDLDVEKNNIFDEVAYDEQNVDGIPMSIGRVRVNAEVSEINKDVIIRDVIDFIEEKHPSLHVTKDSLDLSKLKYGEIEYVVAQAPETQDYIEDTTEANVSNNGKKIQTGMNNRKITEIAKVTIGHDFDGWNVFFDDGTYLYIDVPNELEDDENPKFGDEYITADINNPDSLANKSLMKKRIMYAPSLQDLNIDPSKYHSQEGIDEVTKDEKIKEWLKNQEVLSNLPSYFYHSDEHIEDTTEANSVNNKVVNSKKKQKNRTGF